VEECKWSGARYKVSRVANVYKMASYTLILLKKFAARLRGKGLFIAKGGGEKFKADFKSRK